MPVKSNKNITSNKIALYGNNIKTYTGYYTNNWNTVTTTSSKSWRSIACNEDGFIVVITNGDIFNYSSDGGVTWNSTTVTNGTWQSITYSTDYKRFVVVGIGISILYSTIKNPTTGSHWLSTSAPANLNWQEVIAGPNLFIAAANNGSGDNLFRRLMLSENGGLTWRIESAPVELIDDQNTWKSISYGNGTYVIISNGSSGPNNTRMIYSKNDGNTWHLCQNYSTDNIVKGSIVWSDSTYSSKLNLFIAVATSGNFRLAYSENGIYWRVDGLSDFVHSSGWSSIVWSQELELFVVIENTTSNQKIMTSNDGKNWTLRLYGINKIISSIIWNRFHGNFIASSSDTAGTTNIITTKSLGINSFLPQEQYYNKKDFSEFNYDDINDQKNDGIIEIYNAPWGISPKIDVNINNTYTINEPFAVNTGLSINSNNGVIRSTGTSTVINKIIEKIITVTNLSTRKTLNTTLKIKFIVGDVTLIPGDFYYNNNNSNNLTIDISSNTMRLDPNVEIIKPYLFRYSGQLFSGLTFDNDTGVITGHIAPTETRNSTTLSITVYSKIFDEEENISLVINTVRIYTITNTIVNTFVFLQKTILEEINAALVLTSFYLAAQGNIGGGILLYNYATSIETRTKERNYISYVTGFLSSGINYNFFLGNYTLESCKITDESASTYVYKNYVIKAVFFSDENIPFISPKEKFPNQQYLDYSGRYFNFYIYFSTDISDPFNNIKFYIGDTEYFNYEINKFSRKYDQTNDVTIFYMTTESKNVIDTTTQVYNEETGKFDIIYTYKWTDTVFSIIKSQIEKSANWRLVFN